MVSLLSLYNSLKDIFNQLFENEICYSVLNFEQCTLTPYWDMWRDGVDISMLDINSLYEYWP